MTPKEKAEELIFNFSIVETSHWNENMDGRMTMEQIGFYSAKQCALITVNEIIKAMRKGVPEVGFGTGYWSDVRKEIENI